MPPSGDTSRLFRTLRSGHDGRKTHEVSDNTLIYAQRAPRVFLAVCADVELTSNLAPVANSHYTNCSRNSRPTILAAR
jgi:hypothetical protein